MRRYYPKPNREERTRELIDQVEEERLVKQITDSLAGIDDRERWARNALGELDVATREYIRSSAKYDILKNVFTNPAALFRLKARKSDE